MEEEGELSHVKLESSSLLDFFSMMLNKTQGDQFTIFQPQSIRGEIFSFYYAFHQSIYNLWERPVLFQGKHKPLEHPTDSASLVTKSPNFKGELLKRLVAWPRSVHTTSSNGLNAKENGQRLRANLMAFNAGILQPWKSLICWHVIFPNSLQRTIDPCRALWILMREQGTRDKTKSSYNRYCTVQNRFLMSCVIRNLPLYASGLNM